MYRSYNFGEYNTNSPKDDFLSETTREIKGQKKVSWV